MKNSVTATLLKIFLLLLLIPAVTQAQERIEFPMNEKFWAYDPESVSFETYKGQQAAIGKDGAFFVLQLKDQMFGNGTIEFDVELSGQGFPGISFRMSDDLRQGEHFYLRSFGPVSPQVRTSVQYAAIVDSTSMWDLTDDYQSGARLKQGEWNHVKLVINGNQMKAYVNDMEKPALRVPRLEGIHQTGRIVLNGNVIFANFKIIPDAVEDVVGDSGFDLTENDTRYLRHWRISKPRDFPYEQDLQIALPSMYGERQDSDYPTDMSDWEPIKAGARSIVNVTRKYGMQRGGGRRLVWMSTVLQSDKEQIRTLHLGFSDEVWVFVNGQLIHIDKNLYGTPSMKEPKGRCTIENSAIQIPLKEGENVIVVGLASYFYGWGLIARLDSMDGIMLTKDE